MSDPATMAGKGRAGVSLEVLQRRIRVAQGQEPGDLLLRGGRIVNVFTQKVEAGNVVLADGWIAGAGPYDWQARQTLDLDKQFLLPGLIDSHMHLESTLLLPAELARLIVPHGTTATISDSHEIGNVLGIPGIQMLLAASADLAFDLFFMASACVPATRWEDAGAVLGPPEVAELLNLPRVLGLAEMMDIPAVLRGDPWALEKIRLAWNSSGVVDGHAPGMTGPQLWAYIAAGIRSDHESRTVEEALGKAQAGMLVQVREGSTARNLDTLLPLLARGELGDSWTLVTDDIFPEDLRDRGHLDYLLRRVVAGGVPAVAAIRQATLIPARHYGLGDRGAVAPGYRADLVVMEDLTSFLPRQVFKNGLCVARDGRFLADTSGQQVPAPNTIHVLALDESAFQLNLKNAACPVIGIVPGQLVTRLEKMQVSRAEGHWQFDPALDVVEVCSIERHRKTGRIGRGLVSGFGLNKHGALGSSVAHDSHNLIIAGTNPGDMLACARALAESGGGFVVVSQGQVKAGLPLPIAGLLSRQDGDTVCRQLQEVQQAAAALGCPLERPFGTLSFLALPVIPQLRITDRGLWDVSRQKFLTF